jgi:hypothetical protein
MFQFPWFPLPALCVQAGVTPHDGCWVAPFRNPRIEGWSAPPRGLSQPPTSFIGSHRQGIHRWPLITWVLHTKMLVLAMKFSRNAGETSSHQEGRAEGPANGDGLRTFTTEDRTGTSDSSAPCANERCQSTRRVHQLGVQTRHGTNVREPSGIGLLRKEVIQPHLPVRLPCYDFTPIANPTFGSSVPEGFGH